MNTPPIAVIIPARNEAPRIGKCLNSVRRALDFANVTDAEVIVVDDDSSDETSEVAQAHGAQVVRQVPRRGPLAAWTAGVARSSAPLLFFVDADCTVDMEAFAALLQGFTRPIVGVVAARSKVANKPAGHSIAGRSASFSAALLHETKCRLGNHEFLPIGRLMGVRRQAWQAGDHRWPCDLIVATRAKSAGWEIIYQPNAVVYYQPVATYQELRSDYIRTTMGQALLGGDVVKPLPRATVRRAASVSLRRQPLNGAAWLTVRARLWTERSGGRLRPQEGFARWDRTLGGPADHPTAEERSGTRT